MIYIWSTGVTLALSDWNQLLHPCLTSSGLLDEQLHAYRHPKLKRIHSHVWTTVQLYTQSTDILSNSKQKQTINV